MMSSRRKIRPCQQDTNEDQVVKKRRGIIAQRFPHREAFEQDLNGDCCDARTLCARSVKYLEAFQSRDTDHFWLDMSRSNYLTTLYFNCSPPELEKATRQNDQTLKRNPRNFNALWCRSEIFLHQRKYSEAKVALCRMEDILEDSVQMLAAKAELGVSYPDFGPAFYQKSIRLLEEVLSELTSIPDLMQSNDVLRSRTIKWTFDLAHTYNRLMNKGTIQTYWDDSIEPCPGHDVLFKRIKELFEQIEASGDLQYTAEAWIELADAYKKYEERIPAKERLESLPDGMAVDDCFRRALELAPDDVFVLERCGRHYRQRATDISGFERAVDFLKRCIERDPCRDVAYHHMGLAYRSMWLEQEKHEEARIHTNPTKQFGKNFGKFSQNMKRQKSLLSSISHSQPPSLNMASLKINGSCTADQTEAKKGSGHTSVPYSRSRSDGGVSFGFRNENQAESSAHTNPRLSEPVIQTNFFETIPPKYQNRGREVPKHHRKPDYYDKLRAGNPLAKDPKQKFLREARNCFQMASDIRQGKCCRYLVDLARTYVSASDLTKAWDLLVQASQSDYSSNDGAYLYEQWGLMAERQVENEEDVEVGVSEFRCIEEVKNLYRHAIRFSAESRERSRVGFYRLRDIIYDQMQDNPSEMHLQKEHLLLYKTIQDAKKAQEVLDNMKSEESVVLMWELVDLFHSRNRPEDPDAAFSYLALLADGRKLREPVDSDRDLEEVLRERIAWVIEIIERRVREGCRTQDTLSKVFEWLVTLSDGDVPSDKGSKDACVVCILAPSSETPGVERVMSILTQVVGVDILQGFVEDSPDLALGKSILDEIESMVRRVRNAVVVMQMTGKDGAMNSDELQMLHILKPLVNHPDFATKRFCRAVSTESKAIECDTLNVHPEWNLDETVGKAGSDELSESTRLAFSLLRALFSSTKL